MSWDLHDLGTHKELWIAPDKMFLIVSPSFATSSWSECMQVTG